MVYISQMLKCGSCLSIRSVCGAFLAKCIDNFRPSLWFLVPPPFSSTSPDKPLQPIPAVESSLGASPQHRTDTEHFGCPGCPNETNLTISSNVLSSISGSMLTIPPETRSENGNPALRRRPANAETSFTSLNHTALVGQCQKGGWGMGTPMQWANTLIGRILSKGACFHSFAFYWLANRATKASPVTPPNKRANGWRCCCYPEEEYTKATSIIRIALLWDAAGCGNFNMSCVIKGNGILNPVP